MGGYDHVYHTVCFVFVRHIRKKEIRDCKGWEGAGGGVSQNNQVQS